MNLYDIKSYFVATFINQYSWMLYTVLCITYHAPYYVDHNAAFVDSNHAWFSWKYNLLSGGTYTFWNTLILYSAYCYKNQMCQFSFCYRLLEYASYPLREAEQVELAWPLHLWAIRACLARLGRDQLTDRTLWRLPQLTLMHGYRICIEEEYQSL